jgi:ABC-2 type transport system permease protein
MKRLLNIEFLKLIPYTGFWLPAIFWAGLYLLSLIVFTQLNIQLPGLESGSLFAFPHIWNVTTWLASWFNLLLAIMIIIYTCNEFTYRMFRQQVVDGLTRAELFSGKVLLITVFAVSGVILVLLATFITGVFYNTSESWSMVFDRMYLPIVYFIQAFAYMSIGLMVALLFRNAALSIITFILYFFPFEPIIRNFFPDEILMFFPMKVISNLTPPPDIFQFSTQPQFTTTINGQIVNSEPPLPPFEIPLWGNTLVALGYIALFLGISWWLLKKKKL